MLVGVVCASSAACKRPRLVQTTANAATGDAASSGADPLPSWSDGATKAAIRAFVTEVTTATGPRYVAPEDRTAVFDNDGTLWCEKPAYVEALFTVESLRRRAAADPASRQRPAYRAAAEGDASFFRSQSLPELMRIVFEAHDGQTRDAYAAEASAFLGTAQHPRFGRRYAELTYAPMIELGKLLRDNGFHVFVVTGGTTDFVRELAEHAYGVAPDDVVGTDVTYRLDAREGRPTLVRTASIDGLVDDGPAKPVNIGSRIGRRPVVAVGNSDGDLEMLEFAGGGALPALRLLVHHDDGEREYAYDAGATKALATAKERGITVVSMKRDFRAVFGPGK